MCPLEFACFLGWCPHNILADPRLPMFQFVPLSIQLLDLSRKIYDQIRDCEDFLSLLLCEIQKSIGQADLYQMFAYGKKYLHGKEGYLA